jgi:hypothetical protein
MNEQAATNYILLLGNVSHENIKGHIVPGRFCINSLFGATLGDLLTKTTEKGGLNLGTIGSSSVLSGLLVMFFYYRPAKFKYRTK